MTHYEETDNYGSEIIYFMFGDGLTEGGYIDTEKERELSQRKDLPWGSTSSTLLPVLQ